MLKPFRRESRRGVVVAVVIIIEGILQTLKTEISCHQKTSSTICSSASNLREEDHSNNDNLKDNRNDNRGDRARDKTQTWAIY